MREGAKTGNRRACCRLVTNLGHREVMIMLPGGWGGPGGAETRHNRPPCGGGHDSAASLGRWWSVCLKEALVPVLQPGTTWLEPVP